MRLGSVGCALALVLAASACTTDEDDPYTEKLVSYDDQRGEPNRIVELDDGQLAIGSPDRHRIVIQWQDPDGSGWTEPETVWTDEDDVAVENTVRHANGTVAIRQLYTSEPDSDSDIGTFDIGIVCRDLSCATTDEPGGAGEAQVTPDGRYVLLGATEEGAVLWTEDEGIHVARWSGHPGHDPYKMSASDPLLAPDGSLRVVGALHPRDDTCTYELYVGDGPGSADLTKAAEATLPLVQSAVRCATYLLNRTSDRVAVRASDLQTSNFSFEKVDGGWRPSFKDPRGASD